MKRLIAEFERWKAEAEDEALTPWQAAERAQKALSLTFPDREPIPLEVAHAFVVEAQRSARKTAQREVLHDVLLRMRGHSDALQPLLYQLLRDHLPAGVVEKLVADACVHLGKDTRYSNEHLGAYAAELRSRLLGDEP